MDKRAMVAFDNALTAVAIRKYEQFSNGLPGSQVRSEIREALEELGKLTSGKMPNYDKWVSLFYNWYQPSHIRLAYLMITPEISDSVTDNLHIVDFGCGALAMQFGVVFAVADALKQGRSIYEVRIDSFDASQHMIHMGQEIWKQFKIEARKDAELKHLSSAFEIVKSQTNLSETKLSNNITWAKSSKSECWLSAMHVIYATNRSAVRQELQAMVTKLNPDKCFATAHNDAASKNLLTAVWSFIDASKYHKIRKSGKPSQSSTKLTRITEWRRQLNKEVKHPFLKGNVTWEWDKPVVLIYTKSTS